MTSSGRRWHRIETARSISAWRVLIVAGSLLVTACNGGGESGGDTGSGSEDPVATLAARLADCGDDSGCSEEMMDLFLTDCLAERGFVRVLEVDEAGRTFYRTDAAGQEEILQQAFTECTELTFSVDPPGSAVDLDYYAAYYEFLLALRDCVIGEGYPVGDPPSKDAFVESQGAIWHPYEDMDTVPPVELARLEEACPQVFKG